MRSTRLAIFCAISLLASLALAAILYPFARLPDAVMTQSTTPQAMEKFDQVIDMGEEFGTMTVIELMAYYLENPPQASAASKAPEPKRHFGGC